MSLNSFQRYENNNLIKNAIHIIVDSGVDKWFFIKKLADYPDSYNTFAPFQFKQIHDKFKERVRITIPDYPDDYIKGQTFENGKDNVDKTIESIKRYVSLFPDINWMPVAQANYLDFDNFRSRLKEIGSEVDRYGWVGLGTVCKTHNTHFIEICCKALMKEFPNAQRHAFGATSESYPIIRHYVTSFDSTAYTWYTQRRKPKMMVINELEREQAFISWLFMANKKLGLPELITEDDKF